MRRTALTPVAILVAVLAVMVAGRSSSPARGPAPTDDPSSTANGRAGTLALYDWLPATGAGVHRIYSEFDLGGTDVLISADAAGRVRVHGRRRRHPHRLPGRRRRGDPGGLRPDLGGRGARAARDRGSALRPHQRRSRPALPGERRGRQRAARRVRGGHLRQRLDVLRRWRQPGAPARRRRGAGRPRRSGSAPAASTSWAASTRSATTGSAAAARPPSSSGWSGARRGDRVGFDEVHHLGTAGAGDQGLTAVFQGPLLAAVLLAVLVVARLPGDQRPPARPPAAPAGPGAGPERARAHRRRWATCSRAAASGGRWPGATRRSSSCGWAGRPGSNRASPTPTSWPRSPDSGRSGRAPRPSSWSRRAGSPAGGPTEDELLGLARRVDALEAEWGVAAIR